MMLPKFMSSFMVEGQNQNNKNLSKKTKSSNSADGRSHLMSSLSLTNMDVGLRFLIQITNSQNKSNVLVKSALRKPKQTKSRSTKTSTLDSCFLKTCNLCNKKLSPDKDIYMYRGDQGFCSIECRNRQMVLDEMRESKSSTKQMVGSYRHCSWNYDARLETRLILEDLRMQRLKSKPIANQNHWAIVS